MVGYLYSKYWWRYKMTMDGSAASCRALMTGRLTSGNDDPNCFEILLDLIFPPLDPELAPHEGASYNCNVVGESKYQEELKAILGRRRSSKPAALIPRVMASLIADDAQDPIRVEIDGVMIGTLSPGNTKRYRALMVLAPDTPKRVPAIIGRLGGMLWDSRRGLYDVRLELWLPTEAEEASRFLRVA